MKKSNKKRDLSVPSAIAVQGNPETAFELINKYGTYNIQPTAESDNDYPKIAQGIESKGKRSKE